MYQYSSYVIFTSLIFASLDQHQYQVRNRGLAAVISACGGGVRSLLSAPLGGFYVGGGDGSLTYIERENFVI